MFTKELLARIDSMDLDADEIARSYWSVVAESWPEAWNPQAAANPRSPETRRIYKPDSEEQLARGTAKRVHSGGGPGWSRA
jgi:hypothetical protein